VRLVRPRPQRQRQPAAGRRAVNATLDRVITRRRAMHAGVMTEALGVDTTVITAALT
jgi:hypothetical protein